MWHQTWYQNVIEMRMKLLMAEVVMAELAKVAELAEEDLPHTVGAARATGCTGHEEGPLLGGRS